MTNADLASDLKVLASDLKVLRADLNAKRVTIEDVGPAFERLTYELGGLREGDDERLRALVNDIELIQFTRFTQNQPTAMQDVLARAPRSLRRTRR